MSGPGGSAAIVEPPEAFWIELHELTAGCEALPDGTPCGRYRAIQQGIGQCLDHYREDLAIEGAEEPEWLERP